MPAPLLLTLTALAAGGAYWWSLHRRPKRDCWRCKGRHDNVDTTLWRGARGRCRVCHGTGYRVRWGVRLLMPDTARAIKAGRHGRNY